MLYMFPFSCEYRGLVKAFCLFVLVLQGSSLMQVSLEVLLPVNSLGVVRKTDGFDSLFFPNKKG